MGQGSREVGLVTKISNGNVVIEVPDDKAFNYCIAMGYHIVRDETLEAVEVVEEAPKPRRGRPPKKAG